MKGMKGRFFKKLKFISTIGTLKRGLVGQISQGGQGNFTDHDCCDLPSFFGEQNPGNESLEETILGKTDILSHDAGIKGGKMEMEFNIGDEGDDSSSLGSVETAPAMDEPEDAIFLDQGADMVPLSGVDVLSTDSDTCSLPNDLPDEVANENEMVTMDSPRKSEEHASLLDFPEKCPPGGNQSVVFYTTSLRGIRKTFEDCTAVRFLLRSFKICFQERDVSLHLEYREELRRVLGCGAIPPKLFIMGRYIGGADEVVMLHEQGQLGKLLVGIQLDLSGRMCGTCANVQFIICLTCHGSCRVARDAKEEEESRVRCPECNENGLIRCPVCF